jgi:hypothetical protein
MPAEMMWCTEDQVSDTSITGRARNVVAVVSTGFGDEVFDAGLVQDFVDDEILPWSFEGLLQAQKNDTDIAFLLQLLELSQEKPSWDDVALKTSDVKTLWGMWPRLSMRRGLLMRRFEAVDGLSVTWQIVLPKVLRHEFLCVAHGGMTGGHLGREKTSAAVKSRAYWPTWSSDVSHFLQKCAPCAQYHRGSAPRQAEMQVIASERDRDGIHHVTGTVDRVLASVVEHHLAFVADSHDHSGQ